MGLLIGKVIEEFKVGDRVIKIRYPKFEDIEDLQKYINALVDENAYINRVRKVNRKEEIEFVGDLLKKIENKKATALVVEANGKVMGLAEINKGLGGESHVGTLGIGLGREIRALGLGKKLMQAVIEEAKKNLKIEIVRLEVFTKNKVARNLYKKFGFREVGFIKKGAKKGEQYYDVIIMVKYL